jgi:hypothetical protein
MRWVRSTFSRSPRSPRHRHSSRPSPAAVVAVSPPSFPRRPLLRCSVVVATRVRVRDSLQLVEYPLHDCGVRRCSRQGRELAIDGRQYGPYLFVAHRHVHRFSCPLDIRGSVRHSHGDAPRRWGDRRRCSGHDSMVTRPESFHQCRSSQETLGLEAPDEPAYGPIATVSRSLTRPSRRSGLGCRELAALPILG